MRVPSPRFVVTLVAGLAIFLVPVATAASASAQMSVTAQPNKTLVQTAIRRSTSLARYAMGHH